MPSAGSLPKRHPKSVKSQEELNIQYRTRNTQCPRESRHRLSCARELYFFVGSSCRNPIFGWKFLVGCWIFNLPRTKIPFRTGPTQKALAMENTQVPKETRNTHLSRRSAECEDGSPKGGEDALVGLFVIRVLDFLGYLGVSFPRPRDHLMARQERQTTCQKRLSKCHSGLKKGNGWRSKRPHFWPFSL